MLSRSYSLALPAIFGLLFPIVSSGTAVPIRSPLTKIRLIHALTAAEARSGVPIEVEGVVTAESGFQNRFFLEDRTGGVYVERGEAVTVTTGDYIRVRGVSTPGQFAPNLRSREIQVLRHGSPLPVARRVTFQDLSRGQQDCLWVELRGVIHSATVLREWGHPTLGLALEIGGGIVSIRVSRLDDRQILSLVDATVTVRGVAGAIFNQERQRIGFRLFATDLSALTIVQPAPVNPFSIPETSIQNLMSFELSGRLDHRVRVRGTVTYQEQERLYLQSGSNAILVRSSASTSYPPGTGVDAIGFVAVGGSLPELRDSQVQQTAVAAEVLPKKIAARQLVVMDHGALLAPYDALLVELEGDIVDESERSGNITWLLRDRNMTFEARLPKTQGRATGALGANADRIRVTGICLAELDDNGQPSRFSILLRSPADITPVRVAWWNSRQCLVLITLAVALALGILVWSLQLKRAIPAKLHNQQDEEALLKRRFECSSRQLALFAAVLGAFALAAASLFQFAAIRNLLQNQLPMTPLTAAAAILAGLSLRLRDSSSRNKLREASIFALAFAGGVLSLAAMLPLFFSHAPNLERMAAVGLGLSETGQPFGAALLTFAALTCICLVLIVQPGRRLLWLQQAGLLLISGASIFAVLAWLYGLGGQPGGGTPHLLPVPTALALLALSLAVLFRQWKGGVMTTYGSLGVGGILARRLTPSAILITAAVGWLHWQGQHFGFYGPEMGLTIFVFSDIVGFSYLITRAGTLLNAVDAQKAAERQKLMQSELRFRQLADAMPQIVWSCGADGKAEYVNRRWYEVLGHLTPNPSDIDWTKCIHPADIAECSQKWQESQKTGEAYEAEYRLKNRDGCYRWYLGRGVAVIGPDGKRTGWFGTCTDVEALKRAHAEILALNLGLEQQVEKRTEELIRSEEQVRLLLESIDEGVIGVDVNGFCTFCNPSAVRLLGWKTVHDLLGRKAHELCHHTRHDGSFYPAQECKIAIATASDQGAFESEELFWRADGSSFPVEYWSFPMHHEGRVVGCVVTFFDITQRKQAQRELEAARLEAESANRAKSQFLAAMSHEIRTPLNAILGMADLLWESQLDSAQREYVELFRISGANLLTLVNDLLDLSKIEAGHLELEQTDFALDEVIERTIALIRPKTQAKQIGLSCEIAAGTPVLLRGDPTRLQQILVNLLSNASKFTEQGTIRLAVRPDEADCFRLHFEVADTGIGIPADKLQTIFQDFTQADSSTTRRFGGTGLGLGICRRLAALMGGQLAVRSELGAGSTFSFDAHFAESCQAGPGAAENCKAPATARQAREAATRPQPEAAKATQILIADDSEVNRFLLKEYLKKTPYTLTFAENGRQALEAVRGQRFDLILIDVQMPEMDGLEATALIRNLEWERSQPPTPILALSANARQEDIEASRSAGCDAHLSKPISKSAVLSAVKLFLRSGPISAPSAQQLEESPMAQQLLSLAGHLEISGDASGEEYPTGPADAHAP